MLPEFTIRFGIDDVSRMTKFRDSSTVIAHNLPWKLTAEKETSNRTGNAPHLGMFLNCNWISEKKLWSVEYEADFVILNRGVEKMRKTAASVFDKQHSSRGFAKFQSFEDLMNSDNGLLDGDKLTIECRVRVQKLNGIKANTTLDFTKPSKGRNNVVLKIGEEKLHVSKDLLSTHSPVFESTFFGNFEEENKDEIELHDLVYDEFVDLLNVIYPTSFEITAFNVQHILKLADRFQVESVLDRITAYLIATEKFATAQKLKAAEEYRLHELRDFCIDSFEDAAEVKAIMATPEYKCFSDSLRAAICEKGMRF